VSYVPSRARLGKEFARYNAKMRHGARRFLIAICLAGLLINLSAQAQQPELQTQNPSSALAPMPDAPSKTQPHAFWDRTNILLFSGVAVFRGLDYASTRNFLARGREEVLIPDDIVNNSAAFASLEAAATLTSVGLSYLLHRTRHHKLERWLSIGHIGVTGFGVVRNYSLESKH
jgi:hypothetical protein